MSMLPHGWVRVWIPPVIQTFGTWVIRVEQASGGPNQLIPAPPEQARITIEGAGLFGMAQFAFSLTLEVYVEPTRITEIHIPTYWLDQIAAPAGAQEGK